MIKERSGPWRVAAIRNMAPDRPGPLIGSVKNVSGCAASRVRLSSDTYDSEQAGAGGDGRTGDVGRDRAGARGASAGDAAAGPPPGGGRGAAAAEEPQVLKDVPPDQLQLTMQYIAASLGVRCNYCHVQGQNDLDDKETKKTARQMMKMVDQLNTTFFDGKPRVSCASCHNGRNKPVRTAPLAIEMTPQQAAAAAAGRGRGGAGGPGGAPGGARVGAGRRAGAPAGRGAARGGADRNGRSDPREIRAGARWNAGAAEREDARDDGHAHHP